MLSVTKHCILSPVPGSPWAGKMVLNPAMIADPEDPEKIHMLFRATGPWPQARLPERPLPYPIFLGYGVSCNGGADWQFDLSRPAMAPRLEFDRDRFLTRGMRDGVMFDYANGCIEDPRLFYFEEQLYLSVACRAFPPGPYWEKDDPVQCMPEWASKLNPAVRENSTVTMLYRVDLAALAAGRYTEAFSPVGPLHDPDLSDDRDAMLFPRRLEIGGKRKIACLHRPKQPWNYACSKEAAAPSIFLAFGDELSDFHTGKARTQLFAGPAFAHEANRVGASWAPLELEPGLWLLPYHGKQDDRVGYTQNFMLLRENGRQAPDIIARPAERLLYATEPWELEGEFTIPCLFTCSGLLRPDGTLLMGYGAADRKVGLASIRLEELLAVLRP